MRGFAGTPVEMVVSLWRHRDLVRSATAREILARYRSSFFGVAWSFINPLLMLAVYTFIFGEVFRARWDADSGSTSEFALLLFAGLIVFNVFSECVTRAPTLIVGNPNYVKKVIFPLEILSVVSILAALYHALIAFCVWLVAYLAFVGAPPMTLVYLPLVLVPFCTLTLGLSWILAALGVFFRDISQIIGILTTALMFLSPIFYPVTAVPAAYWFIVYLNPMAFVIQQAREVMYWGRAPDFGGLSLYAVFSAAIACLGFYLFQKTRRGFADVL